LRDSLDTSKRGRVHSGPASGFEPVGRERSGEWLRSNPALRPTPRRSSSTEGGIDQMPEDRRRWQPGGDLKQTAKEISQYISDSGSAEATIVASDEL
jgi:hypothetical protein